MSGLEIKDIQELIDGERTRRYSKMTDLVNLTIEKIAKYLKNTDSSFPFDSEKLCFEMSKISKNLSDLTIERFYIEKWSDVSDTDNISYELPLDENDSDLFMSFEDFRKYLQKSTDSIYHLNLNSTEWGIFFKELELRGFTPLLYIKEAYNSKLKDYREFSQLDPVIKLESNWRDVIKIVIFLDSPF